MALETKTVSGKRYYYYRYYFRVGGRKLYREKYIGPDRPGEDELRRLRGDYRRVVTEAREEESAPPRRRRYRQDDWDEEEDLPVYLL